jgi:CheY-like chemotaxis protein
VTVVSAAKHDRDLFRHAATAAKVPLEVLEAESAAGACVLLGGGVDLILLDGNLGDDQLARLVAAARAAPKPPFTVLLAEPEAAAPFATDALAAKPADLEAKRFVNAAARIRLPSRVLVVDDSSTTRTIVRKTLAATVFRCTSPKPHRASMPSRSPATPPSTS